MQSLSDSELAQRISEGYDTAVEAVDVRYAALLIQHAFKMLQDEHAAEDVVHDIFSNLLAGGSQLEIKGALDAYLYCAARNGVLMSFRKSKNQQKYMVTASLEKSICTAALASVNRRSILALALAAASKNSLCKTGFNT
ncbi:RNA polymerase sigma factor [Chitinophaga rhizophila]|uniref:RNA polymerase sigma-70 region 2 domain-containing protein n=1 Tax=Chitinophaga rhizophila TaxID=2866212 RepID=A0ABS7GKV7_9BACT|nr:sigma factor [Chitinophaga rhizophila]MBW8687272.1 hypothetical protein [Chitinophaga rhizophila]